MKDIYSLQDIDRSESIYIKYLKKNSDNEECFKKAIYEYKNRL